MADNIPTLDFSKVPGVDESGGTQSLPGSTISQGSGGGFLKKVVNALPKNLSSGLFGDVNPNTGTRRGGVAGFVMADSFRDAFSPNRIYENRRNRLLEQGFEPEAASDFAFRVATGQSIDDLDEDTQKRLKWDSRIDKGFAALDTPVGGVGKMIGFGVGFMGKNIVKRPAGAIANNFFGNIAKGTDAGKKSDKAFDVYDSAEAINDIKKTDPTKNVSDGKNTLDEMADMFNDAQPNFRKSVTEGKQKSSKFYDRLRTEWTDKFTPIRNLTTKIESKIGKEINFKVDPYVAARLYQGVNGKIQNTLDEMGTFIKKAGDFNTQGQKNLSMYLTSLRMAERAGRNIKNPRNITQEGAEQAARLLETPEIKEAAQGIKKITDDLLVQSHKAGLIGDEAYKSIVANNQSYVPFDVLAHMDDNIDSVNKSAGGFSVAEQNVVKSLQGTDKDIADPLEALTRKIIQTTKLIERNEVAKKVARLSTLEDVDDIKKFDKNNTLDEGNDVFHVYEDGQKVSYQAPKDVIEAMKGLNKEEADLVTGLVGKVNSVFRQSVTTLNIAFSIPNIFRDVQDSQLISKHGFMPIDWAKGLADTLGKTDMYKQWRQDGGAFSTYVSQATSARMTVKDISEGTAKKRIKTIMNPLRLFEAIGSASEEATRLAVYRGALRKGEARDFAAYDSRQATVDFARSGTKMKTANLWVPFINARLQGSLNVTRVAKENPKRLALRAAFLVGSPTVASYLHNREYPEYYDIPQWEKDSNFIIMNGTYIDKNGDSKPSYYKIPKGHIGRIVANPMENFMVMQDSESSQEWDKLAVKLASGFSPVSFDDDGDLSATAVMSGILTPLLKVPIEVHFANKDFFTGRNIVPRNKVDASSENQFRDDTSDLAKDLGDTALFKKNGSVPSWYRSVRKWIPRIIR